MSKVKAKQFRTHVYRTTRTIRDIEALLRLAYPGLGNPDRWNPWLYTLAAISLLQKLDRNKAFQYLRFLFLKNGSGDYPESMKRSWAMLAMGYLGDPRALDLLFPLFNRPGHYDLHNAIEAIGRIGDTRGLAPLTVDGLQERLNPFRGPFLRCWALAGIAAKAADLTIKRQITIQLLATFPDWEPDFYYDIAMHQMPWLEQDMLPYIATLLADRDPNLRLRAAWFLGKHGNSAGSNLLLEALQGSSDELDSPDFNQWHWTKALVNTGDRRVVTFYLSLFNLPKRPRYAAQNLYLVLDRWGKTLTDEERTQFTQAVPYMLGLLPKGIITEMPWPEALMIQSINSLGSDAVQALLDEWLSSELSLLFEPYIKEGDRALTKDFLEKIEKLVSRHSGFTQKTKVLVHPMARRYAFQILRKQYEVLQAQDEKHYDLNWTIAHIGWLGDLQALPFLEAEFDRLIASLPRHYKRSDWRLRLAGEIHFAIINLGTVETIPFFLRALNNPAWIFHRVVEMDALRDYVRKVPDRRVVEALLSFIEANVDYYSVEIIHAIGMTGTRYAVPGLLRLLAQRDRYYVDCGEVITALARIARANLDDLDLVNTILSALAPLLELKTIIPLSTYFHPVETIRIDQHTALALQVIGTPDANAHIQRWRSKNTQ